MPNPRFMEFAKRQMNSECPVVEPRETKYSNSELTQILERDENGKPKLNLTSLEGTGVRVPTQEEYDTLMQVYECGGWDWNHGKLSTSFNCWNKYEEETCVRAEERFVYANNEFYIERNQKILSTSEFYDIQKINLEMIKEINQWFDGNGK
ncbi:hypothetical protein KAT36_04480 [Candidatus Pacearchaeota archaeon]|nr:hypothetical protein [Candidatus Pacearchaeota archaeon]